MVLAASSPANLPVVPGAGRSSKPETTTDGVKLQVDTLASGLDDVSDVAVAPEGLLFVSERVGRIRVLRDGVLQPGWGRALSGTPTTGGELLAIAVDPGSESSRFVYALHTTTAAPSSDRQWELRMTRLRECPTAG